MVGIYKITSPSGRIYIGQSWDIEKRWSDYKVKRSNSQRKLEHSLLKYGIENHIFEVIHELPADVEQEILDRYEQLYMDAYRDGGVELLNIREAGSKGKLNQETKNKIGKANAGKPSFNKGKKIPHSKETIEKIKNTNTLFEKGTIPWNKGKSGYKLIIKDKPKRILSEEERKKLSKILKGKKKSPRTKEHVKKIANKIKRPLLQFDLEGNFIREWSSLKEVTDTLKIDSKIIISSAKNRMKRKPRKHKFIWKYKNN